VQALHVDTNVAIAYSVGTLSASSGGARANDTLGRRKKRARADGITEQNINLQGMNFIPEVDEASARASEIAAAEKAVHDANNARHDLMKAKTGALVAILATLKEVFAQIYDAEQEVGVSESSDASLSVLKAVEKSLLMRVAVREPQRVNDRLRTTVRRPPYPSLSSSAGSHSLRAGKP
jgi:hypothetical protein